MKPVKTCKLCRESFIQASADQTHCLRSTCRSRKAAIDERSRRFSIDWPPGFVSQVALEPRRTPAQIAAAEKWFAAGRKSGVTDPRWKGKV